MSADGLKIMGGGKRVKIENWGVNESQGGGMLSSKELRSWGSRHVFCLFCTHVALFFQIVQKSSTKKIKENTKSTKRYLKIFKNKILS